MYNAIEFNIDDIMADMTVVMDKLGMNGFTKLVGTDKALIAAAILVAGRLANPDLHKESDTE